MALFDCLSLGKIFYLFCLPNLISKIFLACNFMAFFPSESYIKIMLTEIRLSSIKKRIFTLSFIIFFENKINYKIIYHEYAVYLKYVLAWFYLKS